MENINSNEQTTPNLTAKLIQRSPAATNQTNQQQQQQHKPRRGVPITRVKKTIPWKQVLFAIFLFTIGSIGITISSLMKVGYISKNSQVSNPLMIVSSLAFIPGFYGVFLSYKAWNKVKGYDWDTLELTEFT